MAPEQVLDQPVDHRADIYQLGLVLYEMFAGRAPCSATTLVEILAWHTVEHDLEMPRHVTPSLASLIRDCVEIDVDARPQSMEAMKTRLLERQPADYGVAAMAMLAVEDIGSLHEGEPTDFAVFDNIPSIVAYAKKGGRRRGILAGAGLFAAAATMALATTAMDPTAPSANASVLPSVEPVYALANPPVKAPLSFEQVRLDAVAPVVEEEPEEVVEEAVVEAPVRVATTKRVASKHLAIPAGIVATGEACADPTGAEAKTNQPANTPPPKSFGYAPIPRSATKNPF